MLACLLKSRGTDDINKFYIKKMGKLNTIASRFIAFILVTHFVKALELIQSFNEQSCTRGTIFSLRIDDHFDEVLINASVIKPGFLSILPREVTTRDIFSLGPEIKMNFTAMSFWDDKLIVLEGKGIVIYNDIGSNNYIFDEKPQLVQYYRDSSVASFTNIHAGKISALFNRTNIGIYLMEDSMFPVKLADIDGLDGIIEVSISGNYIFVIMNKSLKLFYIVDFEIGWISEIKEVNYKNFTNSEVSIKACYISSGSIYLIDPNIGIFEFTSNPFEFFRILPYPGYLISGFAEYLLIDGKLELNTRTLQTRFFPSQTACIYTAIDRNYIYCATTKTLTTKSRLMELTEEKFIGLIHQLAAYKEMIFFGLFNRVELLQSTLGPVTIEGRVPDEVSDYQVIFNASSSKETRIETFMLSVQYSLTNVIVFILLSFITVFSLVFICSFICKCLSESEPVKEEVHQNTEGIPSTERQLHSDRGLLSSK